MRPLFIVFEGIDGSGKTTQAEALQTFLTHQGHQAVISPEPSNGFIGQLIRSALQQDILGIENPKQREEQMSYLFASDRYHHLYNDHDGVFALLKQNCHVITPRYYFSSLAYNCHTLEEYNFVKGLNQYFPNPDLVIYLDIPVNLALERIRDRPQKEFYEKAEILLAVSANYQRIFEQYSGKLLSLEGSQSTEELQTKIVDCLTTDFSFQ